MAEPCSTSCGSAPLPPAGSERPSAGDELRALFTSPGRPTRPLLVFDGDCGFCKRWVARWKAWTGDAVIYQPAQEVERFLPGIPLAAFREAVQLIEPDGSTFSAGDAVFRVLGRSRYLRWLPWLYRHLPGFALVTEAVYRFIARHRMLASRFS